MKLPKPSPVNIGGPGYARNKNTEADWQCWREAQFERDRKHDSRFEQISPGRVLPVFYDDEEGEL